MSAEPTSGQPSEEELRAAYEEELSRVTSTDMMLQAAVTLLNIGAFRLGPDASTRDLEQARDAIDGVRALLEILERRLPGELRSLRDALSQLQMAYAREIGAGPSDTPAESPSEPAGAAAKPAGERPALAKEPESGEGTRRPGPAEASGRLWVPGK